MGTQFHLRLIKTSGPARFWGGFASLVLFLGFGWLTTTQHIPTGRLMAYMVPVALVSFLAGRFWLTYHAVVTVAATCLLVQPLKNQALTTIAFDEVESFSLDIIRGAQTLTFNLTDGTTRRLSGRGDTFTDFIGCFEQMAAQYRAAQPGLMGSGLGFSKELI